MRREIVGWIIVGIALVLYVAAGASAQEEDPEAEAVVRRIQAEVVERNNAATEEEIAAQVLTAVREELGDEHPMTLGLMADLAIQFYEQGNYAAAREMEEEVLATSRRVLGEDHPDTLTTMANLAGTLYEQGDFTRARELFEEVSASFKRVLGEDHPHTLSAMYNLAATLYFQRDLDGARLLLEENLIIRRSILGNNQAPNTIEEALTLHAHVLERFRAQSFLRMVSRRDFLLTDLPQDLTDRQRNLAVRYDRTIRTLMIAQDAMAAVRRDLHRERERIQAEIRSISPRLAEIQDPRPLTADEIRKALDPGTVMLSYSVGQDRTDLFVHSRDGKVESHTVRVRAEALWGQVVHY